MIYFLDLSILQKICKSHLEDIGFIGNEAMPVDVDAADDYRIMIIIVE
jgi:hypothetical protein